MKNILIATGIIGGIVVWTLVPKDKAPANVYLESNMEDAIALQQQADIDCTRGGVADPKKLDGKIVYACDFSQEEPHTHVFPDDISGTTLVCAHLDNVFLPPGVTVIDGGGECGSRKQYKPNPDDDNKDWIVDAHGTFVNPLNQ